MKDLQAFQQLTSSLNHDKQQQWQRRAEAGEQSFREGLQLLACYNAQPGQDILLQAMYKFIDCMSLQRQRIDPLVMLAYIYYALKSPQLAIRYYHLAKAINAQDPQVLKLQDLLTRQVRIPCLAETRQPKPGAPVPTSDAYNQELDFDELYASTETQIATEIRKVMQIPFKLQLVLDTRQLAEHRQAYQRLARQLAYFKHQLNILDAEIDCQELVQRLKLLESRLNQFTRLIEVSEQGIQISADIRQGITQVETLLRRRACQDNQLDPLLDLCDQLADQIDALEQKGLSVKELEMAYNQLLTRVEHYRELCEDTFA